MLIISRFLDWRRCAQIWLLAALLAVIMVPEIASASKATPDSDRPTLLALGAWDNDTDYYRSAPGGDAVLLLNSKGQLVRQIPRYTVAGGYAGCRGIAVSPDGAFFAVCDCSPEGIGMYRTTNGTRLWSLPGFFRSAVFVDDLIYALGPGGVYAIDRAGNIVRHSRTMGGLDIAFDPLDKCLWIVGMSIKKCSLDLKLQLEVRLPFSILHGAAFSVDVSHDGCVWIAGRNAYEQEGDANQLVKMSPAGQLMGTINLDFCPQRVRVDRSDGSVWTTGRIRHKDYSRIGDEWPETVEELDQLVEVTVESHTQKYDSEGRLLVESAHGGTSIEVDSSDGSVWITDGTSLAHCSGTGKNLATFASVSSGQKCLAVIP